MNRENPPVDADRPSPTFLLRDAPGRGPTREQLRSSGWQRLSRGLYGMRSDDRSTFDMAHALGEILPRESGFGHLTSAALRRWWLPNRLGRHVFLATTRSGVHVQRRGVYVRRSPFVDFEDRDGVLVVSAAQTLLELARDLTLVDLVPLVDCALAQGADSADILAAARPRTQGASRLRQAVALADERSESWWESALRLMHVLPGLGPVEAQAEIWDGEGLFIARAHLHLVGTRRYPEVDGGRHREKERHAEDLRRDKQMSRRRHERYGYTTDEIARSPGMVIRDAEDARGWPHDPGRVRQWWRWERYRLAAERRVATSGCADAPQRNRNAPRDTA